MRLWLSRLPGVRLRVSVARERLLVIRLESHSTVFHLKHRIAQALGIPVDQQRIFCSNAELADEVILNALQHRGLVDIRLRIKYEGHGGALLTLGSFELNPRFDANLVGVPDDGGKRVAGGEVYTQPCGWKRYGVKFTMKSARVRGCPAESSQATALSFSPVSPHNVVDVLQNGYASTCPLGYLGHGVLSSPDVAVAEKLATSFDFGGKQYKVLIENRVNVLTVNKKPLEGTLADVVWISPSGQDVLPHAVLIKELDS